MFLTLFLYWTRAFTGRLIVKTFFEKTTGIYLTRCVVLPLTEKIITCVQEYLCLIILCVYFGIFKKSLLISLVANADTICAASYSKGNRY